MPDAPRLSILVVSYNTREMTLDCLRSVAAETRTPHEVIVVDNASDDGSPAAIAATFPQVRLLAETENHGFARANNIAAEAARGDYVLLLNPDTLVLDRALDRLLTFAEAEPQAMIWGGRTLRGDRALDPASCWRRITLWGLVCSATGLARTFPGSARLNPEAYGGWDRSTAAEVDIVTGCLLLMRKADWDALGGFDTTFHMYGEEADLCLRARERGARPMITPKATIVHYRGASERVRADKMVRLLRAKAELIARHVPAWQRPAARVLFAAWPWSRAMAVRLMALAGRPTGHGAWVEIWKRRAEWKHGFE